MGQAQQVAQKEAADARKKKRTKEVQRKEEKKKEVARRVKTGERRSDVESELASDDPTDLDDMVCFDEEESHEVVVTSAERRGPAAMSAGEEHKATRHVGFLRRGSVGRARTPSVDGRRSGRGQRPLVVSPVPS